MLVAQQPSNCVKTAQRSATRPLACCSVQHALGCFDCGLVRSLGVASVWLLCNTCSPSSPLLTPPPAGDSEAGAKLGFAAAFAFGDGLQGGRQALSPVSAAARDASVFALTKTVAAPVEVSGTLTCGYLYKKGSSGLRRWQVCSRKCSPCVPLSSSPAHRRAQQKRFYVLSQAWLAFWRSEDEYEARLPPGQRLALVVSRFEVTPVPPNPA